MLDLYHELKFLISRLNEFKLDYALCGVWLWAFTGFPGQRWILKS
jgi:hypothetical protein